MTRSNGQRILVLRSSHDKSEDNGGLSHDRRRNRVCRRGNRLGRGERRPAVPRHVGGGVGARCRLGRSGAWIWVRRPRIRVRRARRGLYQRSVGVHQRMQLAADGGAIDTGRHHLRCVAKVTSPLPCLAPLLAQRITPDFSTNAFGIHSAAADPGRWAAVGYRLLPILVVVSAQVVEKRLGCTGPAGTTTATIRCGSCNRSPTRRAIERTHRSAGR
jgi:hypothetical protein